MTFRVSCQFVCTRLHLYSYQQLFHDSGYNPISCENLSAECVQFITEDLHKLEVAQVCQSYVVHSGVLDPRLYKLQK